MLGTRIDRYRRAGNLGSIVTRVLQVSFLPRASTSLAYLGTGSELGQKRAVEIGRPLKKALTE